MSLFFQKSSKKSNNGKAIDKKRRNLCLLSQARVECGQLLTLSKLQKTLASNKRSSSLFFKCVIHLIRFDMKLQYLDLNMKSDCKLKVAFFQKVRCVFQISKSPKKNIPKNYPGLEIKISSQFQYNVTHIMFYKQCL